MSLLDVNLITYNHEKFVATAIESVLDQKTSFEYKLIIGDDCSTDGTQSIIRDYAQKYPQRIQVVFALEHRGIRHRNRIGIEVLRLNTAKYVALLDGDDYWTDPYKLQKQVDFLETHPDFSISFHNVEMSYEDKIRAPRTFCPPSQKEASTIEDLLEGNFMQTCSVMFRNHLCKLPDWFCSTMMGDWTLHILNGQYGKIGYLNEVMAVYRVHQTGFWSSMSQVDKTKDHIQILDHLIDYLDDKYKRQTIAAKALSYQYLGKVYSQEGDMTNARRSLLKSFRICLSNRSIPNRELVGRLIKLQTLSSYEWLRLRFSRT